MFPTTNPIRFAFGVHLHQPVGNFDSVFEQHLADVYLPLLERVDERDFLPVSLHLSGPLLEWLEAHGTEYLDLLGRLAADGKIELLLSGYFEPVLVSLPRSDRVEQIGWMREALLRRFGVEATGLWLTERVWEPELAEDLANAGVRYALVDDRHFLVCGFRRDQLHQPWMTESDGRRLALLPIDERLRYLIPFRPPAETAAYLSHLRAAGHGAAVLADDGEKFGGWPGTKDWVYNRGWLDDFLTTLGALVDSGEVILNTFSEVLRRVPPGGLAYLPTASYREMEGWALPADAARRFQALQSELGEERMAGPDGALLRGTHWRNFFVKYSEANRMHKKMQALSALCRKRGDPIDARRAIGRAQCNDAYWHGVFGGLYLPHLRDAIWRNLAVAEGMLRQGEQLVHEVLDIDADGLEEIWVHSAHFSAIISPDRGGALEEFTHFGQGINYANVLTRRRESYHVVDSRPHHGDGHDDGAGGGAPSIHEIEGTMTIAELPPIDSSDRALLVDRVLAGDLGYDMFARGDYDPVWTAADGPLTVVIEPSPGQITVLLRASEGGIVTFEKRYRFGADGALGVDYRWRPAAFPAEAYMAPELSYAGPLEVTFTPAAEVWGYDIATVSKSERGLEETLQGRAVTPRWPAAGGEGRIDIRVLRTED